MARLVARNNGEPLGALELIQGSEYFIGRGADCALVLPGGKSLSRHHLRVFSDDSGWHVELLAKYGVLTVNGRKIERLDLTSGIQFAVPPYEFTFSEEAEVSEGSPQPEAGVQNSMVLFQPPVNTLALQEAEIVGNSEATSAGVSSLTAYLKIEYLESGKVDGLKLEGQLWVAGRDASAEIVLNDSHVSRRHFELARSSDGYYVIDLGSANGTELNGVRLEPHEPQRLESGDRLTIMTVAVTFEIRDQRFASLALPNLPPLAIDSGEFLNSAPQALPPPMPFENSEGVGVIKLNPGPWWHKLRDFDYKKHKVRIAIGVLGFFVLYGLMSGGGKNGSAEMSSKKTLEGEGQSVNYNNLSADKKAAIKDSYNLAYNLYIGGKYVLCVSELKKLHDMIPYYENSKEMVTLCNEGAERQKVSLDLEYKEKQRQHIEEVVLVTTENCKAKLLTNPSMTEEELQSCLGEAVELAPEHPRVIALTDIIKQKQLEKQQQIQRQEQHRELLQKAQVIYQRARTLTAKRKFRAAIDEYQTLLSGNYPDPGNIREKATRELASIKTQLKVKVSQMVANCKDDLAKNKFKSAYEACSEALREDPTSAEAASQQKFALSELRREMKSIYEDSVLEESLGNVDSAKEKWKKIMEGSLPGDEYFTKAKQKLQKYGIGL